MLKSFITCKTSTGPRRKILHEETWNAASYVCWQSVQGPCRVLFENCRCSWNKSSWPSDLNFFSETFPIFIAQHQKRNQGVRGNNFAGAESLWGTKKLQQCHKHFSKQDICFRKTSGSNIGAPNVFLGPGAI